jgi:2'-5' RNA ligase
MELMRLFVALDLPEDVRKKLRDLVDTFRKECPKARWIRPESMHVTLKFIGHVPDEKLDAIMQALEKNFAAEPVDIAFRALGFFPNERRPRVVWCGVQASANLPPLVADIEGSLEPVGIARESRPYVPHLTLARIDPEKAARESVEKLVNAAAKMKATDFGSARATEFHLYQSVLKPSGAEYTKVRTFPLVRVSA